MSAILQDVTGIVDQATSVAKSSADVASKSGIAQDIKAKLLQSSAQINSILGSIADNGIVSQDDYAALDEQMRIAKATMLQAQTQNSLQKYAIGGVIILSVFGVLWYMTKNK
jgi:hypothetical protein